MTKELRIKTNRKIRSFEDIEAWKEGHLLVIEIYKMTKEFPKDELFGLTSQMRRCAVSITSNIAEGFSRQSYKEKSQFYSVSLGSVTELQSQLFVAKDISLITNEQFKNTYERTVFVHKFINGLIKKSKEIHNS